jgi:hypothetical protein
MRFYIGNAFLAPVFVAILCVAGCADSQGPARGLEASQQAALPPGGATLGLSANPSALTFTASQPQTFTATDQSAGSITVATSDSGVATVTPESAPAKKTPGTAGHSATFTIMPHASGNAVVTVADKRGRTVYVAVTVSLQRLYVSNLDAPNFGSVTVYAAGASGNAAPVAKVVGPNTRIMDVRGIAVDASREIYLISDVSQEVLVFAANANGDAAPIRTIAGPSTGICMPKGIVVDAAGKVYVSNFCGSVGGKILVFPAGANGDASPVAEIAGPASQLCGPWGLALDTSGRLYVANVYPCEPSITVYAPNANGSAAPLQVITGTNTSLCNLHDIAVDSIRRIYVPSYCNESSSYVSVFAPGSNGNVTPISIIAGTNTKLDSPLGIAANPSGEIVVANTFANRISVFAAAANGDVAPISTIAGPDTNLRNPNAVALH